MSLFGPNNRPMAPVSDKPTPVNGAAGDHEEPTRVDVRALPTGTLFYNLIRTTMEEVGLGNAIHHMQEIKKKEKMVVDPPELQRLIEFFEMQTHHRYVMANELNERFADVDEGRRIFSGIEVHLFKEPAPATEEIDAPPLPEGE